MARVVAFCERHLNRLLEANFRRQGSELTAVNGVEELGKCLQKQTPDVIVLMGSSELIAQGEAVCSQYAAGVQILRKSR